MMQIILDKLKHILGAEIPFDNPTPEQEADFLLLQVEILKHSHDNLKKQLLEYQARATVEKWFGTLK